MLDNKTRNILALNDIKEVMVEVMVKNYVEKEVSKSTLNKFKTKQIQEKDIIKHNIIPLKLVKQTQYETNVTDEILTVEQAISKAKQKAEDNIKQNLNEEEYIIRSKYLKSTVKESIVEVEMFFAVYENITDYALIG